MRSGDAASSCERPPRRSRRRVQEVSGDGADGLPPFGLRGLLQVAQETGAFWPTATGLIFLLFMIVPAWQSYTVPRALGTTVASLVFGALYLATPGVRAYSRRIRLTWLALIWLNLLVLGALLREDVVFMVMYVVIVHGILLPWTTSRVVVPVLGMIGLAWGFIVGEQFAVFLAIGGVILALSIAFGIQRSILEGRVERAEQRSAVLAVAAERERIGRDLHDILGHSLTTITVSAQLAQRLLEADPAAAREQLAEIERISRQSLADVRATASGMQQVRAATEIASARSVLIAAGIEVDAPVTLPALPDDRAELLGYAIREGITNVVRHSRATRCTITLDERSATVADDGVGLPRGAARTGLAGLQSRLEEAGGTLVVGPGPDGGTVLRAELPDGGPAGAEHKVVMVGTAPDRGPGAEAARDRTGDAPAQAVEGDER